MLAVPTPVVFHDKSESDTVANNAACSFATRFHIRVPVANLVTWQAGLRGIRVGEASNPGPAASRATKRRREERKLAEGSLDLRLIEALIKKLLPALLAEMTNSRPGNKKAGRGKSRPSPKTVSQSTVNSTASGVPDTSISQATTVQIPPTLPPSNTAAT